MVPAAKTVKIRQARLTLRNLRRPEQSPSSELPLQAALQRLHESSALADDLHNGSDFCFTSKQKADPPVRDRSDEYGATIKADAISMLEIKAALAVARGDNAGGSDADLVRCAARWLGVRRVGSDLQVRLAEGLAD